MEQGTLWVLTEYLRGEWERRGPVGEEEEAAEVAVGLSQSVFTTRLRARADCKTRPSSPGPTQENADGVMMEFIGAVKSVHAHYLFQ